MSPTAAGATPIVRRLLPILPPLSAADLLSRATVFGPVTDDGRVTALQFTNPSRIAGELTMDMASQISLTVEDPDLAILRNPLLDEHLTFSLGDDPELRYIANWVLDLQHGMGGFSNAGTSTTLTFWGLGEAALKGKTAQRTWSAAHMNFEAFANVLAEGVRDVIDLTTVVPRPGSTPPRETDSDATSSIATGSDGSSGSLGWSTETAKKVTVKGRQATPDQLETIDTALRQAVKDKPPALGVWAMMTANIGEAECNKNALNPSSKARGLFQLMPAPGWQARLGWDDIPGGVDVFLNQGFASAGGASALARANPHMSPGTIASKVEGSDQGGAFYDPFAGEAKTIIELWSGVTLDQWHTVTGPAGTSDPRDEATSSSQRPTSWRIGSSKGKESYWTGLGRTCEGLGRRRFVSADRLVAARDQDLILAAPHMVLAGLTPRAEPVLAELPETDLRGNAELTQISLRVFASGWTAPPGGVVHILDAGKRVPRAWLVKRIGFVIGDPELDIDLQQPTTEIPSGGGSSQTSSAAVGQGAQAAITWAEQHIGIKEQPPGSNDGPEVGALIKEEGGRPGDAWCGWFCHGALRAAGLSPTARMAYVPNIHADARAATGVFRGVTSAAHGQPGDLVIFGPDSHVGLLVSVNVTRQQVETIEGNTSDACRRRTHNFSEVTAIAQVDYTKASTGSRAAVSVSA